jgi:hypothetical protein
VNTSVMLIGPAFGPTPLVATEPVS